MTALARFAVAVGLAGAALVTVAWRTPAKVPFGFSLAHAQTHAQFERRFLQSTNPERIRDAHKLVADQPHMAGSARDRQLAEWIRDVFREAGLDDVAITEHQVLLPWPLETSVEMTAPRPWRASMRERPARGDRFTEAEAGIPFHAYAASGDITAPVVYAGNGTPDDFDWLQAQGIDVRGKIVLVRSSVPYSYRGFKAFTAERLGAAGLIVFSDPADDGFAKGKTYPDGPWGPDSRIERGGIGYDFIVPGDPLTPGWASIDGARRIERSEARSLPSIVSAPLSFEDARVILEALGGPEVPSRWRGAGSFTYRAGPGRAVVRLRVRSDDSIRPIWTVTGLIRGTDRPDDVVIVGNHRDAWLYGGVDPSSGTAALVELARTLGELTRAGWRPQRSILFASWDAEEFALTSSTEWSEQHQDWLRRRAVAYLNVDSAASGQTLSLTAVPTLNRVLEEVASTVRDPATGLTLAAAARDRITRNTGAAPSGRATDLVDNQIGGGSDYTAFLNHLGVPIADLSFEGPYGVYHSIYDTHDWVSRIGDPGFRYHAALVQLWGLVTMRLAGADVLPLDYEAYARELQGFVAEAERRWTRRPMDLAVESLAPVNEAVVALRDAARQFATVRDAALEGPQPGDWQRINQQLLTAERGFLDPDGLPQRPWYRHVVYAPAFSYAPELLPGIAAALEDKDLPRARGQAERLAAAIRRVATALETPAD
jgi:N-acetylated-alpha-linked acidic dipeptidase